MGHVCTKPGFGSVLKHVPLPFDIYTGLTKMSNWENVMVFRPVLTTQLPSVIVVSSTAISPNCPFPLTPCMNRKPPLKPVETGTWALCQDWSKLWPPAAVNENSKLAWGFKINPLVTPWLKLTSFAKHAFSSFHAKFICVSRSNQL